MDIVQSRPLVRQKTVRSKRLQREALIGLLFLSPWLIGFVFLKALPILVAFGFSLTNFKMVSPETTQFVGLENYVRLFKDNVAGASLFGFLIILSAIESVPKELYEAARVDGAGPLARFIYVTLPMVSPAIFFTLVVNLTGTFGGAVLLDRGYVMRFSLSPMESYINETMFSRFELGYASTLAWATFVVMMALTMFL